MSIQKQEEQQEVFGLESFPSILKGKRALVVGGSGELGGGFQGFWHSEELRFLFKALMKTKWQVSWKKLKKMGGLPKAIVHAIDSVPEFCRFLKGFGDFDIVISAYGPFLQKPLALYTPQDWEHLVGHNLTLPGALVSLYLSGMLQRHFGRFLFFGGTRTDALLTYKTNAAYASAKAGLNVLVKSLAAEGRDLNVASLLVCPGLVDTEYLDDAAREALLAKAPGVSLFLQEQLLKPP